MSLCLGPTLEDDVTHLHSVGSSPDGTLNTKGTPRLGIILTFETSTKEVILDEKHAVSPNQEIEVEPSTERVSAH